VLVGTLTPCPPNALPTQRPREMGQLSLGKSPIKNPKISGAQGPFRRFLCLPHPESDKEMDAGPFVVLVWVEVLDLLEAAQLSSSRPYRGLTGISELED